MRQRASALLLARLAAVLALATALSAVACFPASGKDTFPPGRIAFVRKGDIWVWHDGESERIVKDGAASDPRWSPTGQFLLFVRSGDSYSDLILDDLETSTQTQLTHNGSDAQVGSPDYVATSSW